MDDDMSYSGEISNIPTAQNKPDQNDGGTMKFKISGSAHLISPIQANRNSGESFTINNSYPAPGNGTGQQGNTTRDIPIGTGQKGK